MEIKSLLFTLAPLLLPRVITYLVTFYREIRHASSQPGIRPVPSDAQRALNILFLSIIVSLTLSLPTFADENVFSVTKARLQTDVNVIFARLALVRPDSMLTDGDNRLRSRFQTADGRLLYLQYGHDALANCLFCNTASPETFMYYSLPSMVLPHLLHLAIIGVLTSRYVAGLDAARWRGYASLNALLMAAVELYIVIYKGIAINASAVRASDIYAVHWIARTVRYLAFAASDALFALAIYLTATRRFFNTTKPLVQAATEQTADIARLVEGQSLKSSSIGTIRNTIMRDPELRQKLDHYWTQERSMMTEVDQDGEVAESLGRAVERMNMPATEAKAAEYAAMVITSMRNLDQSQ